jgi:hypothetical protein
MISEPWVVTILSGLGINEHEKQRKRRVGKELTGRLAEIILKKTSEQQFQEK